MVKSVYIPREKKSKEKPIENLDFAKILSDAKQLTQGDELVKQKETKENQHLIETLTKIDNLTNGDLGKKDIAAIFQSFGKNFKEKLKEKLTIEQMENIKNEIEYLINNSTFDDKETEIQMDNMYTALGIFLNPSTGNETVSTANTNIDSNVEEKEKDENEDKNEKDTEKKEDTPNTTKELKAETPKKVAEQIEDNKKVEEKSLVDIVPEIKEEKQSEAHELPVAPADNSDEGQIEKTEYLEDEVNEKDEEIEPENIEVVEENEEVLDENTSDETDKSTKENTKIDMSKNIKSLGEYVSEKEFPGKSFIQSIINEKDDNKKKEKVKLLQLQLVPSYYEGQIDGLISQELLTAIEKYITKNLNKKGETILKSSNSTVIRYGPDGNITDNANILSTVIKIIGDKSMGHAYFLDYQDFEYTIENKTTITTTIDNWNYFYDIQTGALSKQNWDDPVQDITHNDVLQKHFKIIAIAINK